MELLDPGTAAFSAAFTYFLDMSDAIDKVFGSKFRRGSPRFSRRRCFMLGFLGAILQVLLRLVSLQLDNPPLEYWAGFMVRVVALGTLGGVTAIILYNRRSEHLRTMGALVTVGSMVSMLATVVTLWVARTLTIA